VLAAVRAFGVMLGGSILLLLAVAASVIVTCSALIAGDTPGTLPLAGTIATLVYVLILRPRMLRWGASRREAVTSLPGDEIVPNPGTESTRAVTINTSPREVWPWLAQIGQDRGGFYSYEWIENLAGCQMRNADRIHPEWQHRREGELVKLHPGGGLRLLRFKRNQALILENWGAFVLQPLEGGRTRLLVRGLTPRGLAAVAYGLLLEIPHFVMERRMLLGIKQRAQRVASASS